MQIVDSSLIKNKKVLLRLDIDVPLKNSKVVEDFRLKTGLPTLKLCLEQAAEVIVLGHVGRPEGKIEPTLSVAPVYSWMEQQDELRSTLKSGKLKLLENLRFEGGEEGCEMDYAKELAALGEIFINEAFAAYRQAASTTVLPTLLPHAAGLRFAEEVRVISEVRENPQKPLVVIMGGAKVEDKLPVIKELAKIANSILVGGKLIAELDKNSLPQNVVIGELNEEGTDITPQTSQKWKEYIKKAQMIVWNGPLGKVEEPKNFQTHEVANMVITSGAESLVGGGDTVAYLDKLGLLDRFSFVSTGGGAMLKLLEKGTLPTIEVLK